MHLAKRTASQVNPDERSCMIGRMLVVVGILGIAAPAGAQQWTAEGHGSYARTTQTHTSSWGLGTMLQATWGAQTAPVQLGTSLGFDWMKQESGGPNTYSVTYDATLQPGGNSTVTPYAGGEVSANWLRGGGAPSGTQLGLQYIVGVQLKPSKQSKTSFRFEVRPGYIKTQEHSITWRLGVAQSL